ncbi:hypothetical protein AAJ76_1150004422 [Vairimorpha ceranae]|uniref:Uncharacterized protein n=1 Tax=Vairimorpha ceranae TaxID=40302 RepID=A0A0F9WM24_9MICR|nr:hypothetical protein AAJ76_1150004422 [Vairimorpha ceranae]KKO74123.1 hypothetical protein AAJ76_1150004422 [Vairimorpha ceranae]
MEGKLTEELRDLSTLVIKIKSLIKLLLLIFIPQRSHTRILYMLVNEIL